MEVQERELPYQLYSLIIIAFTMTTVRLCHEEQFEDLLQLLGDRMAYQAFPEWSFSVDVPTKVSEQDAPHQG